MFLHKSHVLFVCLFFFLGAGRFSYLCYIGFCQIVRFKYWCCLHLYLFSALLQKPRFCCRVLCGVVAWSHTSCIIKPCFAVWTTVRCSDFCNNGMYCRSFQCSLQSFLCSVLTFLVFLFDSGNSLLLYLFWIFKLFIKCLTYILRCTLYELAFGLWKRDMVQMLT